ncbi:MAG: hypothetical protein EPO52_13125 [Herbiconiux sp.]|uniref:hypothetical protein n=1 Tax=Herbiconiux sp. TaxID=1871186 RepID=UPI00121254CA|nr:hypothetical protein [Herbiconiux sp.]TAJ47217.1 MAG: hypothetical protein EPO52_13125 [Herbiconiux sp.]
MPSHELAVFETPLGRVVITAAIGGDPLALVAARVAMTDDQRESRADWWLAGDVHVCLRTTSLVDVVGVSWSADELSPTYGERTFAEGVRAALLTVTAPGGCGRIELRAGFAEHRSGGWATGQDLAARSFAAGATEVVIGGGDDDLFARRVRDGSFPADWATLLVPDQADTVFGETGRTVHIPEQLTPVLGRSDDGVGWMLPPVPPGASVDLHAVVAWAVGPGAATAAWYAVDWSPDAIRRACVLRDT